MNRKFTTRARPPGRQPTRSVDVKKRKSVKGADKPPTAKAKCVPASGSKRPRGGAKGQELDLESESVSIRGLIR